jgi:hypothetical protein
MELPVSQKVVSGVTINYGPVPNQNCWRMVWTDEQQEQGKQVENLFESGGRTQTRNHLYLATTYEECEIKATTLGMTVPPPELLRAKAE